MTSTSITAPVAARASRSQFDVALEALIAGDILVITTVDRFGWSTQNTLAFAQELRGRGAGLRVLNLGGGDVDTSWAVETIEQSVQWRLHVPLRTSAGCFHGGASFDAVGTGFDDLSRRRDIINADVLDAWFDPAPAVTEALEQDLSWLLRTSPPVDCAGLVAAIAAERLDAARRQELS